MKGKRVGIVSVLALAIVLVFSTSAYATPPSGKNPAERVSAERIYGHIAKLADRDNARMTGFEGEHRAADYLVKELKRYGLKVERQTFPILAFRSHGSEVKITTPDEKTLESHTFTYTPATPKGGLTAELADAGLGLPEDFSGDVKGKIALIQRGEISFFEKAQNAAQAGAVGAIIYNNTEGPVNGTLGEPAQIPVVSLSKEDGEALKSQLTTGQRVEATMVADVELFPSHSQNVIGTIPAQKGPKKAKTIVVGAHYDGVDSAAANDNASGTGTLLELARVLSKEKLHHNVRVIFFGAEEVGLVGSTRYVESLSKGERDNIAAMINMDMVGVGDTIGIMTASETADSFVANLAEELVKKGGHDYERYTSTRSDHVPFEEAGIPTAFLNYHPDPYYHTKEDTPDKISKENLHHMGTLVTRLTHTLADNNKLPKKKYRIEKLQLQQIHYFESDLK
ncbi:aminopeptidase YwaD [Kroppenstedtia guangzhouensis]|uniref:Aminopeptidase YwaD n=1 Tax=Kroppenstedtia guangzhouensis TaxID=1274356 RepID=A0ABQ1GHI3_9BACL|nr:DUF4910 domain-containing protein [Kroppenstedtia guangzhouensis]GGA43646.1 aminopeptidase YwaD [Kroppenstedtia guangzhouensis]